MQHDRYISPFETRYASKEMQYIFSEDNKFRTWRRLWIALAKAEQEQGLPITDEQIAELEAHKDDINYDVAVAREKECRHDVMSHVYAYGVQCPNAKGIIHLGATSCYVGDNTDVIIMREALDVVERKLVNVIALLAKFADHYKDMPALAYTHLQPAQLTTVGKRATLWLNELCMDLDEIRHRRDSLALLGSKGTTGTQASFVELFEGDSAKIKAVEASIAREMGFDKVVPVSGQTYSRKVDYNVLSSLAGLAQSAMKFGNDMRLLANFKEMEEPFEKQHGGHAVVRAHARRLGEQARRCRRGVPRGGRHPEHPVERVRRSRRVPEGRPRAHHGRAAVHGQREHHDERRQEGRRPSGAAREAARPRDGRGEGREGRGRQERPHRARVRRPRLRP